MHNLFGDTNVAHIDIHPNGSLKISHVVPGDTVEEVLHYVQYDRETLIQNLHRFIEKAMSEGILDSADSARVRRKFKSALDEYTYLTFD